MHVGFFCSAKSRCQAFARVFQHGLNNHGHSMDVRDVYDPKLVGIDAAVILGVQQCSTFDLMHTTEMPFVYLDKGYTRTWDYRRVAINDAQPTGYMPHWIKPDDRHKKFGWEFE